MQTTFFCLHVLNAASQAVYFPDNLVIHFRKSLMLSEINKNLIVPLGLSKAVVIDPEVSGTPANFPEFLKFVRLLSLFANKETCCRTAIEELVPEAFTLSGLCNSDWLHLHLTRYPNVLRIVGNCHEALISAVCINPQFPLVAIALICRDTSVAYLTIPLARKRPRVAKGLVNKFRSYLGGSKLKLLDIFLDKQVPSLCYLDISSIPHLGHYVLNSLGPAVQSIALVKSTNGPIKLARLDNGYLTSRQEAWLLDPSPLSSEWIEYFSSKEEMMRHIQSEGHSLFSLHGSSVDLSLAITTNSILENIPNFSEGALARGWQALSPRSLVIGVGLRGGSREALNLGDLIEALQVEMARRGKNAFYVLDGMAESVQNSQLSTRLLSEDLERELAISILDRVASKGGNGISIVGWPLMDQLAVLRQCSLVIGHQGSSSAKYMWMLGLTTIIHKPTETHPAAPRFMPSLHGVDLNFQTAYRGSIAPQEYHLPMSLISAMPPKDDSLVEKSRCSYHLDVHGSVGYIMRFLEEHKLLVLAS
jgi:hypothetical protein